MIQDVEMRGSKLEQTEVTRAAIAVRQNLELLVFGREHDELARKKRKEECGDGGIECQSVENWCPNSNAQSAGWNSPCDVVGDGGVIDHDALRGDCGSCRVD